MPQITPKRGWIYFQDYPTQQFYNEVAETLSKTHQSKTNPRQPNPWNFSIIEELKYTEFNLPNLNL